MMTYSHYFNTSAACRLFFSKVLNIRDSLILQIDDCLKRCALINSLHAE